MAMFIPNFATVVVLAILVVLVCLSVRLMLRRGMCGQKEACGGCSGHCGGECSASANVEKMLADVDAALADM